MNLASHLYQIQKKDSRIDQIDRRLNELQIRLANDEELRAAQLSTDNATRLLVEARNALKRKEEDVQAVRIKIQTSESSLYGGRIHNPKELQDIQNEIASLKRRLSILEDEQLNSMLLVEEAESSEVSSKALLSSVEIKNIEDHAGLRGEISSLQQEKERLLVERQAIIQQLPPVIVNEYEQLRKQKRGVAVVTLQDNSCSGCGSNLRPAEIQAARASQETTYCSSCGRILFAG